ncbi:MAG: hypothetical protein ACI9W4_001782 [Rhodothermales bacterium]
MSIAGVNARVVAVTDTWTLSSLCNTAGSMPRACMLRSSHATAESQKTARPMRMCLRRLEVAIVSGACVSRRWV